MQGRRNLYCLKRRGQRSGQAVILRKDTSPKSQDLTDGEFTSHSHSRHRGPTWLFRAVPLRAVLPSDVLLLRLHITRKHPHSQGRERKGERLEIWPWNTSASHVCSHFAAKAHRKVTPNLKGVKEIQFSCIPGEKWEEHQWRLPTNTLGGKKKEIQNHTLQVHHPFY